MPDRVVVRGQSLSPKLDGRWVDLAQMSPLLRAAFGVMYDATGEFEEVDGMVAEVFHPLGG